MAKTMCATLITLSPHKPMCVCNPSVGFFLGGKCFGVVCVTARRHLADLATFGGRFVFNQLTLPRFGRVCVDLACASADL